MTPTMDNPSVPPVRLLEEAPLDNADPALVAAVQALHRLVRKVMLTYGFLKSKVHVMAETKIVLVLDVLRTNSLEDSMLHIRELRRGIAKEVEHNVLSLSHKISELYIRLDLHDISMAIMTLKGGRKLYFALDPIKD